MFLLRKFGNLLRGKATPFQIIAGCLLGALIGFMPGFSHAPGLIVVLSLALILINANLFLATIVGLLAKLLSIALMPASFHVGRVLLDGSTETFFRKLINAPVFALFGFESYVATGGLVIGGLVGLVTGILIARGIHSFRVKMATLDKDSPRFHELTQKKWARYATFVFAGGGLKSPDYAALLQQSKIGNPIRTLGAILVVLSVVLVAVTYQFFASSIITSQLRSGLELANGATVDLESAELDLKSGRMALIGVAAADASALDKDIFRAARIEADVSGANLLRKRLQLDRVVVSGATSGETRRVPGRRIDSAAEPSKPIQWPDAETIEDYIKNAQLWRERLAQVKQWIEKITGPSEKNTDGTPAPVEESLEERLKRLALEQGYASVKATHLIEGAPTLLVTELTAAGVTVAQLPGEKLDITARNLSTQPSLAGGAPEISIKSASDKLGFNAKFSGISALRGDNTLAFHYRGLPIDTLMQSLKVSGSTSLAGGTVDLAATGKYFTQGGTIELPVEATLKDTTVSIAGKATKVSSFALPIGLTGSLSNPKIKVDSKSLGNLALKAGTDALKEKATSEIQKKLGDKAGGLLDMFKKPEKK
ncbi:hypothetical protein [Oleiharenicola lentus]|uniref:hypothetical protein n=1 Tax=Oleiharenicola lentus TaxID=2508720 RepID=UPI003F6684EB